MKTYLGVTTALFGLLVIVHLWRAAVEPGARDPWFIGITIFAALMCGWGGRLLFGMRAHPSPPTAS